MNKLLPPGRQTLLICLLLLLGGCSDPAPGEGQEQALVDEPMPEVVTFSEALRTPDIPTIDPSTLQEAEISNVIPSGPRCGFSYTAASPPILAASLSQDSREAVGVIKIHGRLVEVTAQAVDQFEVLVDGASFMADGVRIAVVPLPDEGLDESDETVTIPANLRFEMDQGLRVDYRGWYTCDLIPSA